MLSANSLMLPDFFPFLLYYSPRLISDRDDIHFFCAEFAQATAAENNSEKAGDSDNPNIMIAVKIS